MKSAFVSLLLFLHCFLIKYMILLIFLQFSLMASFPGVPFGIFLFSVCAVVIGLIQVSELSIYIFTCK